MRINDLFWTIQGEGVNTGRRALFVRMPFCNLACSWCDTEFNSFKNISEEELTNFATQESCRFAVITGGEPLMNKETPKVISLLKNLGFEIAVESNGVFPVLSDVDFLTVSPKRDADYEINVMNFYNADEVKIVVDKDFDFSVCDKFEGKMKYGCRLSLSPEHGNWEESVQKIIEFIKERPAWRLNLQTHKIIKVK